MCIHLVEHKEGVDLPRVLKKVEPPRTAWMKINVLGTAS